MKIARNAAASNDRDARAVPRVGFLWRVRGLVRVQKCVCVCVCVSETQSERVSELDELRSGVGMRVTERESEQVKHGLCEGACAFLADVCACVCVR